MDSVIRVAFIYAFLWACFRVLGKRELSKMTPFEFVTLLLIPQAFSRALPRDDYSMTNAVVASATLLSLVVLTSAASHRSRRAARVLAASPTVLVRDGAFLDTHLNRERISPDQIFTAMHKVGIDRLASVRWAILEPDGQIAIIPNASDAQAPLLIAPSR